MVLPQVAHDLLHHLAVDMVVMGDGLHQGEVDEAAVGGPIAALHNGDTVTFDVKH